MDNKKALILALSTGLIASGTLTPAQAAAAENQPAKNDGHKVTATENDPTIATAETFFKEDGELLEGIENEGALSEDSVYNDATEDNDNPPIGDLKTDEPPYITEPKVDSITVAKDSNADLSWNKAWTIVEENLEKTVNENDFSNKPNDTYEVVGKRGDENGIDVDKVADQFLNDPESMPIIVDNVKKTVKNHPKINDYQKDFILNLIYTVDIANLKDDEETIKKIKGLAELDEAKAILTNGELIDYIRTEHTVKEDIEVKDVSKPVGYREVTEAGEQGFNKTVVTEGSPSSLWKVGDFYTSEEIRELAESGNDRLFNKISEKKLSELTKAEKNELFKNGIHPKYKYFDAINPETDEKDTTHATSEDNITEFSKEARAKKVVVGTKAPQEWSDDLVDNSLKTRTDIDKDNKEKGKNSDTEVFRSKDNEELDANANDLPFLNDEELDKKIEENRSADLDDAKAIAFSELGAIPDLTSDEREAFLSEISKAQSEEDLRKTILEAKERSSNNKDEAEKNNLAKIIEQIDNPYENDQSETSEKEPDEKGIRKSKDHENDLTAEAIEWLDEESNEDTDDPKPSTPDETLKNILDQTKGEYENDQIGTSEKDSDEKGIHKSKDHDNDLKPTDIEWKEEETPEQPTPQPENTAIEIATWSDKNETGLKKTELTAEDLLKSGEFKKDDKVTPELPKPVDDGELANTRRDLQNKVLDLANLTAEEKRAYVVAIQRAKDYKDILDSYNMANELNKIKAQPKDTPVVPDKPIESDTALVETRRNLQSNVLGLGKLSPEEKNAYIIGIQRAKSFADIVDIYNQAVALNTSRDKAPSNPGNPVNPIIDPTIKDLKDLYNKYLQGLLGLTEAQKEAYIKQIIGAKSPLDIYKLYLEALQKNAFRPAPTVIERPSYNSYGYTSSSYTPTVKQPAVSIASNDLIYVSYGYKYIGQGYHSRAKLIANRADLQKTVNENKIMINAANYMLQYLPRTVAGVRPQLISLIEKSQRLQANAQAAIAELDEVLSRAIYAQTLTAAR